MSTVWKRLLTSWYRQFATLENLPYLYDSKGRFDFRDADAWLPSPETIGQLPRWAIVAFAGRSARLAYRQAVSDVSRLGEIKPLNTVISAVESSAATCISPPAEIAEVAATIFGLAIAEGKIMRRRLIRLAAEERDDAMNDYDSARQAERDGTVRYARMVHPAAIGIGVSGVSKIIVDERQRDVERARRYFVDLPSATRAAVSLTTFQAARAAVTTNPAERSSVAARGALRVVAYLAHLRASERGRSMPPLEEVSETHCASSMADFIRLANAARDEHWNEGTPVGVDFFPRDP